MIAIAVVLGAIAMAFDRLRSRGDYLEASRGSSQFAEILDQQCQTTCKEIRSLEKLDVQEATVFWQ